MVHFAGLVPRAEVVLDLACGSGRHTRFFLRRGNPVVAVDRDLSGIEDLLGSPELEAVAADLESSRPPTALARRYGAVVVTNYLHRPLLGSLIDAVSDGGILLYETFAEGNERFGSPSRPEFLLRPGELLEAVRGKLRVRAYEDLVVEVPRPAAVQRIAAVRQPPG